MQAHDGIYWFRGCWVEMSALFIGRTCDIVMVLISPGVRGWRVFVDGCGPDHSGSGQACNWDLSLLCLWRLRCFMRSTYVDRLLHWSLPLWEVDWFVGAAPSPGLISAVSASEGETAKLASPASVIRSARLSSGTGVALEWHWSGT